MLKKITKLQNVGLFQSGTPKPVALDKVTLVYAENGRGKSTLATMLRACALGDAARLSAKKTLDATGDAEVSLLFELDSKNISVSFTKEAWNKQIPNIVVFDSEFVEQNVYSGHEVRSDQRQALLEFALGDQPVALKQKIDDLTKQIEAATRRRSEAEKNIARFSRQTKLAQFIKLDPVPGAEQQVEGLRKRIEAAKNAQALAARQDPVPLGEIKFNVDAFFGILEKKLADVQKAAEVTVREHFVKHAVPSGIENWVSLGQAYAKNEDCPFCGQQLTGIALIEAYQSYFNQAYADLKQQVSLLRQGVETRLADSEIESLAASVATNTARIEAWKDQIEIEVPSLALAPLLEVIRKARNLAVELAIGKQEQPIEKVGSDIERGAIANTIKDINEAIQDYNLRLASANSKIADFKKNLAAENIPALQAQISGFELAIARYHPDAIKAIEEYQKADDERKNLDKEKNATRVHLDALMKETLEKYQVRINDLLGKFGAGFTIEQMKPTYQGSGEPRTEYVLQLRQQTVRLGSRTHSGPHFGTALSEGDKRTLAFAFFLARIESDPASIANQILVLDDPVSSLDRNRRAQTVDLITALATRCAQVLILSHDAYFVREVRERLAKVKPVPITPRIVGISRVQHDYSAFADCDIDDICASDYYRHHSHVRAFVDGTHQGNIRDVAKALRPMIEGFYHRRFPGMLPTAGTFGSIIAHIAKIPPSSPLSHVHPSLEEMTHVNDYASRFHHDTNPAADTEPVTDGELKFYAIRALTLIYKG